MSKKDCKLGYCNTKNIHYNGGIHDKCPYCNKEIKK